MTLSLEFLDKMRINNNKHVTWIGCQARIEKMVPNQMVWNNGLKNGINNNGSHFNAI